MNEYTDIEVPTFESYDLREVKVENALGDGYNPNRDTKSGRFTTGSPNYANAFTKSEKEALHKWGESSKDISDLLRGKTSKRLEAMSEEDIDKLKLHTKEIATAQNKSQTKEERIVFRGAFVTEEYTKGDIILDKSFMATSTDKEIAERYRYYAIRDAVEGQRPVMFEIRLPKGSRGIDMHSVPEVEDIVREMLLPANSNLRIDRIRKSKKFDTYEVTYIGVETNGEYEL